LYKVFYNHTIMIIIIIYKHSKQQQVLCVDCGSVSGFVFYFKKTKSDAKVMQKYFQRLKTPFLCGFAETVRCSIPVAGSK